VKTGFQLAKPGGAGAIFACPDNLSQFAMTDYSTLLALVAPVFAMIAVGMIARWRNWLNADVEGSLLKLVVNVLFPCLVFHSVVGNRLLLEWRNVGPPPLVGFVTMILGFTMGYYGGRALGLTQGRGLRTFAFAVGIYNYGFIPIPLIGSLFGEQTLGVLFVHNIGCELAIWSVGVIMVAGASWREGWRHAINAPAITIIVAVTLNFLGAGDFTPKPLMTAAGALGQCAVPLGLVAIGGTLFEFLSKPRELIGLRVTPVAVLLRLGVIPLIFLAIARWAPLSIELKQIMVVQAAMPAGVSPLILARHFGGQPLTAAQVIFGTTIVGLLVIPWWIRFGMMWVGV
jgi:predicted permease